MTKNEAKSLKIGQKIYFKGQYSGISSLELQKEPETVTDSDGTEYIHLYFTDNSYEPVGDNGNNYLFLTEKDAYTTLVKELSDFLKQIKKKLKALDKKD